MKSLPPASVVFRFSRSEKVSFLVRGLFCTLAGICSSFTAYYSQADSSFIFYIALAIGFLGAGLYFLFKRFGQKAHCILTPQYVQIGGRRFAIHELECTLLDTSPWDGAFIITHTAYKRLPFLHKIIHRYAFLLLAVLLAALGIYGIVSHQALAKGAKALVSAAVFGWIGFFQYQNGRIYGFDAGETDRQVLEKELSAFCKTHQVTLHRN